MSNGKRLATPAVASDAERPRLGDHVAARRYLRSSPTPGVPPVESIVLHDTRTHSLVVLGPREWAILRCADGSRDLAGLRLAARKRAVRVSEADLQAFIAELARADLLDASTQADSVAADAPASPIPIRPDAPLDPLPGFLLRCDGRGSCCRLYGSTLFSPDEARRAMVLCPDRAPANEHGERAFTPTAGSGYRLDQGAERARCACAVDGACAFLATDGSCTLHARGGPAGKPLGCRLFPADFADDGVAIRVSVMPECACVMRSLEASSGEPLVDAAARTGADLAPAACVRQVPTAIELSPGRTTSRDRYLEWASRAGATLAPCWRTESSLATDLAAWAWREGHSLGRGGELAPLDIAKPVALPTRGELMAALAPTQATLDRLLGRWRHYRHDRDLSVTTGQWLHAAVVWLGAEPAETPPPATAAIARREAFCLHAWLHSHQLVAEIPLGPALCECALRMLLARVMAASVAAPAPLGPLDELADEPLALVNAWWRAHGLNR